MGSRITCRRTPARQILPYALTGLQVRPRTNDASARTQPFSRSQSFHSRGAKKLLRGALASHWRNVEETKREHRLVFSSEDHTAHPKDFILSETHHFIGHTAISFVDHSTATRWIQFYLVILERKTPSITAPSLSGDATLQ